MPVSDTQFSRRHKTNEAHQAARGMKESRIQRFFKTIEDNQEARALRSPQEQMVKLDQLLGKGQGAVRERARLRKQMA